MSDYSGYVIDRQYPNFDDPKTKEKIYNQYLAYMFDKLMPMFDYDGLPDSIPKRDLELIITRYGHATIAKADGDLYAFRGSLSGEPSIYYMPTMSIVANPRLKTSFAFTIDKNCVIVPNDSLYRGMIPIVTRYAALLTENYISFRCALVNGRAMNLITGSTDAERNSAITYLSDLERGKLGVVAENAFVGGVKAQPLFGQGSSGIFTGLIEINQYILGSFYNEIGLNSNFNLKRESINASETDLNRDGLVPLIEDMLYNRQIAVDKINKMFGTSITVSFNSVWKKTEYMAEKTETGEQVPESSGEGDPEPEQPDQGGEDNASGDQDKT